MSRAALASVLLFAAAASAAALQPGGDAEDPLRDALAQVRPVQVPHPALMPRTARAAPGFVCEDHIEDDGRGGKRPASSLVYGRELDEALRATARLSPEDAGSRLSELRASGQAPGHLGWAVLLALRSRGFVPAEAAFCDSRPPRKGDAAQKWIGVTTADGSRFVLDLARVAASGTGLAMSAYRGDRRIGFAQGGGVESLLDGGAGGLVGSVLGEDQGGKHAESPALFAGDRTAKYRPLVEKYAKKHGVNANLAHAVMRQEDPWGDPYIASPAGAVGLMQLMPETARDLGVDPRVPSENIEGGVRYLRGLIDAFGDDKLPLAVAAYNAGPKAVDDAGRIPDYRETAFYVAFVFNNYYWLTGRKVDYERFMSRKARAWVRGMRAY